MANRVSPTQITAFHNVVSMIDADSQLPRQVFRKRHSNFLFFESDKMFVASFADVIASLILIEGSRTCCLLNFDKANPADFQHADSIFLNQTVTENEYAAKLRAGGPSSGWLFRMDRYGCASDIGKWGIYCEKGNDVAVIAIEQNVGIANFSMPLKRLDAQPIQSLLRSGDVELYPFNQLTSEWQAGLLANYG